MTLKHTHMRAQLKAVLASLADPEYQSKVWLAPPEVERYDSFTLCVSVLFDDLCLEGASEADLVGNIIVNRDEAIHVTMVVHLINELFDAIGLRATDAQYIHHPLWPIIVLAATDALALMEKSDATRC